MATRTYLIFKDNGKEVLNTKIFGNNFWDTTFFTEISKLVGKDCFPEYGEPNDAPTVEVPELKVTRFVDEQGNDLHELEENFVEKLDINGYVFKETTETSDIRTHVYKKVETEVPNDAPTVEVPELKITRFIDTNGVELKNIVEGFVEKDSNIVYENEQYDYVNTTEENGIRTHVYKKHTVEQNNTPNDNTTTPTDNNTTTENKVIEHTAPTGDGMMNTLKLFALSVLGLGFALTKRKGLRDE